MTASCPKCGADDARYLSVVHESGLSAVDTRTRGAGCNPLTILLFPFIGLWSLLFSSFGNARTTGTVQSLTSAKAGPPVRKPLAFSLVLAVVGLFLLPGHTVPGVLLLLVGGLSLYAAWTYNRRVHPYQYQVWEQSAMCQRCGTIFVPDANRITLDAVTAGQLLAEQQRRLVTAAQPALDRAQHLGGQVVQKVVQKTTELRVAAQREEHGAPLEPQADRREADQEN
ncbi:hypothetical protein [Deinococcus aquiradiocola]|uniref:Uncharacterized protein n=1 Tax=Deinococcus aquiradiocola TaxID=393059 RepID=A0A917PH70_9DEIO|nr:hypothetical protein [Deinococcus aquiradiocola]GGJ78636.1 hypothetical protein GCM10008939_23180 [Deinococcus aquiradiocola]